MTEIYTGVKFTTVFRSREIPDDEGANELRTWGKVFAEEGLAPQRGGGYAGNLSCRVSDGFLVTATGVDLGQLRREDLVKVLAADLKRMRVTVIGMKEPSSESMLHHAIYQARPDVQAIFHGQDDNILRHANEMGLVITRQTQPYGSTALIKEVLAVLRENPYIVIKEHGFLSLGGDMQEAGRRALEWYGQTLAL